MSWSVNMMTSFPKKTVAAGSWNASVELRRWERCGNTKAILIEKGDLESLQKRSPNLSDKTL